MKNIDDTDLLKDAIMKMYRKSYLRAMKELKLYYLIRNVYKYVKSCFISSKHKKILIFRLSALGDLITLEGTFRAIRHFYPDAHITFVSSAVGKDLYENSGYFDRIVTFRRRDVFKNIEMFLRYQYDLTFNLQCSRVSHFFLTFVRTGKTVDSGSNLWQRFFGIKRRGKNLPQILQLSGIDSLLVSSYIQQPDQNMISLPYEVIDYGWSKSKKLVALAPGASERWESKKWGDARYLQLASQLIQENFTVILVGSHLEKDVGALIEGKYPQVINLIGKTTLSELKSVLASVDIVVCNDSGPAHLAAGVGTDTITIFGSTGEKFCVKHMPYRGRHECFVPKGLSCHPCYKSKCPTKSECMNQITVENVYQAIKSMIRGES